MNLFKEQEWGRTLIKGYKVGPQRRRRLIASDRLIDIFCKRMVTNIVIRFTSSILVASLFGRTIFCVFEAHAGNASFIDHSPSKVIELDKTAIESICFATI